MSAGYVYCITNPSMPDLVKIGYTSRSMEERLEEANSNSTWNAFPYQVEFAKWVLNANHREKTLHRIFHAYRVNPNREWFRLPVETVRLQFELMDGPLWKETAGTEDTGKSKSLDAVHEFLNDTIYPVEEGDGALEWLDVVGAWQGWKKQRGRHWGNTSDLKDTLISQYGRPPWSDIRLKMESPP